MSNEKQCPEFPFFGAKYPDARCIDGQLYDLDKCDDKGNLYEMGEYWPCPFCNTNKFVKTYADYRDMKQKDVKELVRKLKEKYQPFTVKDFGFVPIFYLLNKNRNELNSIAVEKITETGYDGISFKESNLGWSLNPTSIGKGFISMSDYDFTEQFNEAVQHASNQNKVSNPHP